MQKILRKNAGGITWYVPEDEENTLGNKLTDLSNLIREEAATVHKKGRRKVFASVGTTAGGEEIYLKTFRLTGLSLKLKHLFFRSKAMRELMIGLTARERGVPAVVPLAAGEKRRMGLIDECYVLLKKIDSAINLRDYLYREDVPQRQRSRVIEALGRLARKSHESGIFQTDFSLNNFLLKDPCEPTPTIYLIDFERTYVHKYLSEDMRNWALAKLNRVGTNFSVTDRLRFLKAYSAGKNTERSSLLHWMKELDKQTHWILRKDALRIHSACVRSGRGYKRYTDGRHSAYFLEGYDANELIHLTKEPAEEVTAKTLGPFKPCEARRRIHEKGAEIEVDVYKFLLHNSTPSGARPAVEAWQTANALIKANIRVSPAVGAVEVSEGNSYLGYLIIKHAHGLKDLREAIAEARLRPDRKRVFLWHTARFLSRLHNHGTFSAPISIGDIGVQESSSGKIRLCLMRPFKFAVVLTSTIDGTRLDDRDSDLNRLEAFLGDLMGERDVELLRRLYKLHSSNIPSCGETPCSYTPGRWSMSRFL